MSGSQAQRLVIIGGGQAAAQLIDSLRYRRWTGQVTLVSAEPWLPYQRPPLSKQYLLGGHDPDWLLYRPSAFYEGVNLRLGIPVASIDPAAMTVQLSSGERLPYDKLALCTGSRPRLLDVPGSDQPGVHYLRTLADAEAVRRGLGSARRIVIIGAGFIGLEAAAILAGGERSVTLLAAQNRLLPRIVPPMIADYLADKHRGAGTTVELSATVSEIARLDGDLRVACADGRAFDADLVLVGIGIVPNDELAISAGLDCNDGIVVDDLANTSDPAIVAAGDCTRHPNSWTGTQIRLETVHNAVEQAKTAAASIMGAAEPYRQVPWVWSDQFDLRIQSVGFVKAEGDHVLRRGAGSDAFTLFEFNDGHFTGSISVNRPREFAACRRVLNSGAELSAEQAGDPAFDLAGMAARAVRLQFEQPWPPRVRARLRPVGAFS